MDKEDKKKKFQISMTRILMGIFTGLTLGCFFLLRAFHLDSRPIISLIMPLLYIPAVILTGIRAKQLGRSPGGWAAGTCFCGLIPSVVLFFLGKNPKLLLKEKYQKTLLENTKRKVEKAILSFAKRNRGFVSVGNAAMEADISMDEAQKVLDELVKKGFAQLEVKTSGSLIYIFQDFLEDD